MGSIVEDDGSEEEEAVPPHATEELQVRTLQAGARTVEVEIPDAGPLGMSLASDSAAGRPWVSSIKPDGRIAARPGVKVGMLLLAVDGQVRLASNADSSTKVDSRFDCQPNGFQSASNRCQLTLSTAGGFEPPGRAGPDQGLGPARAARFRLPATTAARQGNTHRGFAQTLDQLHYSNRDFQSNPASGQTL
jgi:hypothetical protein